MGVCSHLRAVYSTWYGSVLARRILVVPGVVQLSIEARRRREWRNRAQGRADGVRWRRKHMGMS